MKILIKIFLVVIIFSLPDSSKPQSITWNRTYNGPYNWYDESYDICQTTDGNFVTGGYTRNPLPSYCLLKVNPYGDTLWFRILPTTSTLHKTINAVTYTADGGCVFTGEGDSLFVGKMDAYGNLMWFKTFGSLYERGYSILNSDDGRFIISGYGGLLLKIDSNGNLIWKKYIPADIFNKVIKGIDGGYIITGSGREGSDTSQGLLLKVDTSGNLKWRSSFVLHNSTASISVDTAGNSYVIGGRTNIVSGQIRENFILRTDLGGNELFNKIFVSPRSELLFDILSINNNRYVISINKDSTANSIIFFITKIIIVDSLGKIIRERIYNSVETQYLYSIQKAGNSDLILCGGLRKVTFGGIDDIWIVRTDTMLNSPSVNVNSNSFENPLSFQLQQNYPNPFNSNTIFFFQVPKSSKIKIVIFNIVGMKVKTLVDKALEPGIYKNEFIGSNLNSGIYFCVMYANGKLVNSKKMFLIK